MRCPFCGSDDTQVKDSRPTEDNTAIRRRRHCIACESRFTTFERVQLRDLMVMKKSGSRAPFDREKLLRSISIALRKRPIEPDRIERIVNGIQRRLESRGETDIQSSVIGEMVMDALAGLDGAHYVDQQEIVTELYQGYRRSTLRMLGLASVVVFVVLQLRYRNLRRGLLAFLPSVLVALTTLGLFGMLGITVNVIAAVSLVVVLGMGVDYGIFSVDSARCPERLGPTLSSLLISCLTSIFVFGVLSLSEQTALKSLGLTVGVGTSFALILSPAVHVLARRLETAR